MASANTIAEFTWKNEAFRFLVVHATLISSVAIPGFFFGSGVRPLILLSWTAWILTLFCIGSRRRWLRANRPESAPRPWRFTLGEWFIGFTGLALMLGILSTEWQNQMRAVREHQRIVNAVTAVLGPDGRLNFAQNGDLEISVCDRTFNDARLVEVVELIEREGLGGDVTWLIFGTGGSTQGTTPAWPGLTDASLPIILRWTKLEMLAVHGTAISQQGKEALLELPRLNEISRYALEKP